MASLYLRHRKVKYQSTGGIGTWLNRVVSVFHYICLIYVVEGAGPVHSTVVLDVVHPARSHVKVVECVFLGHAHNSAVHA